MVKIGCGWEYIFLELVGLDSDQIEMNRNLAELV
jgi:hypothetical protein